MPQILASHRVVADDFQTNIVPGLAAGEERGCWRDAGTIASYFGAHLLARISASEVLSLIAGPACTVERAALHRVVLGRNVRVPPHARLEESLVMDGAVVGAGARLRRVIVDAGATVPAGEVIGYHPEHDRQRFPVDDPGQRLDPRRGRRRPERRAARRLA